MLHNWPWTLKCCLNSCSSKIVLIKYSKEIYHIEFSSFLLTMIAWTNKTVFKELFHYDMEQFKQRARKKVAAPTCAELGAQSECLGCNLDLKCCRKTLFKIKLCENFHIHERYENVHKTFHFNIQGLIFSGQSPSAKFQVRKKSCASFCHVQIWLSLIVFKISWTSILSFPV